jgi:ribosomal protein L21
MTFQRPKKRVPLYSYTDKKNREAPYGHQQMSTLVPILAEIEGIK